MKRPKNRLKTVWNERCKCLSAKDRQKEHKRTCRKGMQGQKSAQSEDGFSSKRLQRYARVARNTKRAAAKRCKCTKKEHVHKYYIQTHKHNIQMYVATKVSKCTNIDYIHSYIKTKCSTYYLPKTECRLYIAYIGTKGTNRMNV